MEKLADLGLISKTCPIHNTTGSWCYEKDRKFPRVYCRECDGKFYSAESSALAANGIGDVPLFLFIAYCFSLRVSQKAIMALAGCDARTVNKYQNAIRQALCSSVDAEKRAGNLMLGGVGKTVEVDEAFVSKRKYARGRKTAKEGLWVVGLTEVDSTSVNGLTPRKINYMRRREARKEKAADERIQKAKRRRRSLGSRETPSAFKRSTELFEIESAINRSDDEVEVVPIRHDGDGDELDEIIHLKQLKREVESLFKHSRKNQSKKTLFFIVERRTKEVLHDIIKANVHPGTTIYTDEWSGYCGLEDEGFSHKTINHSRRFSRVEIDGTTATRITTNHIERVWVELRKTMKHMDKKSFKRFINLETYWELKLFNQNNQLNYEMILRDFAKYGLESH